MYAQLLIGVSLFVASYQDIRERAVNDLVWAPALLGVAYVLYTMVSAGDTGLWLQLAKMGLVGGIALAFTFFGAVGQADAIALALVASDPFPLSPLPPLFATAIVALSHIGYEYAVGNAKGGMTIPMEKFLKEQRWIPKAVLQDGVRTEVSGDVNVAREEAEARQKPGAMVEVSYGVPTVAYLGIGYLVYLAYLVASNLTAFYALP